MCLRSLYGTKIAQEDIICYKYLTFLGDKFLTPYYRKDVTNSVISGEIWNDTETPITDKVLNKFINFSIGYIHSLVYSMLAPPEYYVFECIIPKGTEYAEGIDNDLCSKSIKFVKFIKAPIMMSVGEIKSKIEYLEKLPRTDMVQDILNYLYGLIGQIPE